MRAFIDANVFVRVWTLDVLLGTADMGMLEPRWSIDVVHEAERTFSEVRPGSAGQARDDGGCRKGLPDAMVVGYETRIATLELPDDGDRHVLAAAAESGCDAIVAYELRDFPQETLAS